MLRTRWSGRVARIAVVSMLLVSTLGLSACFPLLASGVAFGALAIIDRRTIGSQTEDQAIELKTRSRLREQLADASGVSATSYNRRVLLTGQVISEADKQAAGAIVAGLDNVRGVYNELERIEQPPLQVTANDVSITTRVKTALLRDEVVPGNSVKVKTENSVVYLMGLVTTDEAQQAAEITSRIAGVSRVITVFEIISADEARTMSRAAQAEQSSTTSAPAATPRSPAQADPSTQSAPPADTTVTPIPAPGSETVSPPATRNPSMQAPPVSLPPARMPSSTAPTR